MSKFCGLLGVGSTVMMLKRPLLEAAYYSGGIWGPYQRIWLQKGSQLTENCLLFAHCC